MSVTYDHSCLSDENDLNKLLLGTTAGQKNATPSGVGMAGNSEQ
jgi:hypothetical protein